MAKTQRLFYTTSHYCWEQGEGSLFQGKEGKEFPFYMAEGAVEYCLLLVFISHCCFHLIVLTSPHVPSFVPPNSLLYLTAGGKWKEEGEGNNEQCLIQ